MIVGKDQSAHSVVVAPHTQGQLQLKVSPQLQLFWM